MTSWLGVFRALQKESKVSAGFYSRNFLALLYPSRLSEHSDSIREKLLRGESNPGEWLLI